MQEETTEQIPPEQVKGHKKNAGFFNEEPEPQFDESTQEGLEQKKRYLIDKIIQLKKRIKYKEVQKKAIEEALLSENGMDLRELKRRLKALEFKISTQAHTPQHERQFIKHMEALEKSYEDAKRIEKMKNKVRLINQDIDDYNNSILKIDLLLKDIRNRIAGMAQRHRIIQEAREVREFRQPRERSANEHMEEHEHYEQMPRDRRPRHEPREQIIVEEESMEHEFTLGDLAIFEQEKNKKKKK